MNERNQEQVLARVSDFLREVIGEEWASDLDITMDTSFSDDLELESIEFVTLAEKLKSEYGRQVDFAGWLGTMDLKEIIGLRVRTLVEYIDQCLSQTTPA